MDSKEILGEMELQLFGENLEELRSRLGEIQERMNELNEQAEGRTFNDEEREEWNELQEEFREVKDKLEELQSRNSTLNNVNNFAGQSQRQPNRPAVQTNQRDFPDDEDEFRQTGGFDNLGDFIYHARYEPTDSRIKQLRDMSMSEGQSGGIFVPKEFQEKIMAFEPEDAIVRPRATVIPAGEDSPDASVGMPVMKQGAGGVYAGVEFQSTAEGEEMNDMEGPKVGDITLEPDEHTGTIDVSNKLLRNSEAASQFLSQQLRRGKLAYEDHYMLNKGDGNNYPLSVLNSEGAINVNRNTTSDIVYEDVLNMEKSMYPQAMNGAVWIATQSAYPQIKDMKDSNGNRVYRDTNLIEGVPAALDGIPLHWTGRVPTLGNRGDLMLVNFTYYLIKDGYGLSIAASEHAKFKQNKTVIKIVWNYDGQSWVKEPLTLEDGSTQVSPIVVLDA